MLGDRQFFKHYLKGKIAFESFCPCVNYITVIAEITFLLLNKVSKSESKKLKEAVLISFEPNQFNCI